MDQSLVVFRDSFHLFNFFFVQQCKNQRFWRKIIILVHFYQVEVQVFTNWSRRLKKTPNI